MPENTKGRGTDAAAVFDSLSRIVYARTSYEDIYASICQTAVDAIPGCDHACISTLRGGGELRPEAATDEVAALIVSFESATGEGPCFDAIVDEEFQRDADITADMTWPELARLTLAQTPVRGMVGYRLRVGDRKVGALDIFSDTPGALTVEAADMGAVVAAFASVALAAAANSKRADQLELGLRSNREIGKAIGLLMVTHKVDDAAAFDVLRRASSDLNIKLAEVARRVVEDHKER